MAKHASPPSPAQPSMRADDADPASAVKPDETVSIDEIRRRISEVDKGEGVRKSMFKGFLERICKRKG